MRKFVNDAAGKIARPGLTSNEIFDIVQLASVAYVISCPANKPSGLAWLAELLY